MRGRRRSSQQPLPFAKRHLRKQRARTHGGARKGAGRKPTLPGRSRLRHEARPLTHARFPIHVTKRVRTNVTRLRRFELCDVLRRAFVHGCRRDARGEFRICQFSIQGNHIHLICEASDNDALARGIQGWSVRVARGLNGHLERDGSVFDDRYHMEILTTPTQTRHALCYVLQNARRHHEAIDARWGGVDPFSSAWWFDGWKDDSWRIGRPPPEMRTVAEPDTWLLKVGWKRAPAGLIVIDEVPPAGTALTFARRSRNRSGLVVAGARAAGRSPTAVQNARPRCGRRPVL